MIKSFRLLLAALLVGFIASATPVLADGGPLSPLSVGARAVDYVPTDGHGVWNGGAQARLNLPLFFAVEGSVDYRRQNFGSTTTHDFPVQLSALFYGPKLILVQPYALIGGGWYDTTIHGPNGYSATQDRFGPHVGAGLEVNLNSNWYIDGSYRFVWLGEQIHTLNNAGGSEHIRDRGHMITLGLNYRI